MVPDLKIAAKMGGTIRQVLHEHKVIFCSWSRYRNNWTERSVVKRALALHQEYMNKARKADQSYGGVEEGTVGPVENKLLSYWVKGLVFGNFGKASEQVHRLVPLGYQ